MAVFDLSQHDRPINSENGGVPLAGSNGALGSNYENGTFELTSCMNALAGLPALFGNRIMDDSDPQDLNCCFYESCSIGFDQPFLLSNCLNRGEFLCQEFLCNEIL